MISKTKSLLAMMLLILLGSLFIGAMSQVSANGLPVNVAQTTNIDSSSLPHVDAGTDQLKIILQVVFGIAGGLSVLMITIAGFTYITSNGNPQTISKAKDTILYAVIGLVISISAFAIVTFVVGRL